MKPLLKLLLYTIIPGCAFSAWALIEFFRVFQFGNYNRANDGDTVYMFVLFIIFSTAVTATIVGCRRD